MNAGRELDAKVAELVMGWTSGHVHEGLWFGLDPLWPDVHSEPPNYSTNIAAAWTVVEALTNGEFHLSISQWPLGTGTSVTFHHKDLRFDGYRDGHGNSESVAHAICLAALKAVES